MGRTASVDDGPETAHGHGHDHSRSVEGGRSTVGTLGPTAGTAVGRIACRCLTRSGRYFRGDGGSLPSATAWPSMPLSAEDDAPRTHRWPAPRALLLAVHSVEELLAGLPIRARSGATSDFREHSRSWATSAPSGALDDLLGRCDVGARPGRPRAAMFRIRSVTGCSRVDHGPRPRPTCRRSRWRSTIASDALGPDAGPGRLGGGRRRPAISMTRVAQGMSALAPHHLSRGRSGSRNGRSRSIPEKSRASTG